MRWKEPEHNEERLREGFIIFPKKIGKETRWLERAYWRETYLPNRSNSYSWFSQEWITFTDFYTKGKGVKAMAEEMYGFGGDEND